MLRGNHESRSITEHFSFREEVLTKFDRETYDMVMDSFDTLPLIALINQQYLGVHGGISPLMSSLGDVNKLNRFQEVPLEGVICDLLWSDPLDDAKADKHEFTDNQERACSYKYGLKPVKKILQDNDLAMVVRGH